VRGLLGSLFGAGAALRESAYRHGLLSRARLANPVVSVGNLSVGGSGKTPVVARIASVLRDEGLPVAVLSRGYGGSFRGEALVVGDGSRVLASAEEAGDEPVMLARELPGVVVAVGRRRDEVGRVVEARFGPRVHVLDDGFQHLRLARDLDLVCLDVYDLADRPLPAGRLRERPAALSRADLVLLTRVDAADEDHLRALETQLGRERTFRVRRQVLGFRTLEGAPAKPPARAFLVAGIARPERFRQDASGLVGVAGALFFRDHHRYRPEDVREAEALARAEGADAILTTAKDAVRFPAHGATLRILVLAVAAAIEDEERFRARLLAVARRTA
jgi:tetraacyldisaccharide 4'-kinase